MSNPWYKEYSDFLAEHFDCKVQKISINAGNSCPNRDGTSGRGGCLYCNNAAFTPGYAQTPDDVAEQLRHGREFFGRKYPDMRYLAYFQSYTSTNGDAAAIKKMFGTAADAEGVVGLVVATRPDSLDDSVLDFLSRLNRRKPVFVEFGAESSHDATLQLVNRCHTWQCTVEAVQRAHRAGLCVGLHLINGLPGENEEMMLETVRRVNALPVSTVKFHQLQIVRGTPLHRLWREGKISVKPYGPDEYLDLCVRIVRILRRDIAIDRFTSQAPPEMVAAPKWGIKNHVFTAMLLKRLRISDANGEKGE